MVYCTECGKAMEDDAKFCPYCGTRTQKQESYQNRRTEEYAGKIIKCPSCGELLNSFVAVCPACGFELRGVDSSETVQAFATQVSKINNDDERAVLIRNFPIPNTREDIMEFMILASTNISGEKNRNVFEAWVAKFEQSYKKATVMFDNSAELNKIQGIYEKTVKIIEKEKGVHNVRIITSAIPNPVFAVVAVFVAIYAIIRLINGQFAGIDIIFDALILYAAYRITNKKKN